MADSRGLRPRSPSPSPERGRGTEGRWGEACAAAGRSRCRTDRSVGLVFSHLRVREGSGRAVLLPCRSGSPPRCCAAEAGLPLHVRGGGRERPARPAAPRLSSLPFVLPALPPFSRAALPAPLGWAPGRGWRSPPAQKRAEVARAPSCRALPCARTDASRRGRVVAEPRDCEGGRKAPASTVRPRCAHWPCPSAVVTALAWVSAVAAPCQSSTELGKPQSGADLRSFCLVLGSSGSVCI